jgi:CSLREA domain-containing protein
MAAKSAIVEMRALLRMRVTLATVIAVAFALTLSTAAHAATITVTTLSDPRGQPGTCSLRDAITAANTKTATNGCIAGTGNDTINFNVTGTIALGSALPQVTDRQLTINGPASLGITINGSQARMQVMQVASGAALILKKLIIANCLSLNGNGGAILNDGALTVSNSTFSGNLAAMVSGSTAAGGAIDNEGTLTITNGIFSSNSSFFGGGGILNNGILKVTNSTFSGNTTVDGAGGGILNNSTLIVTNSTFSGNSTEADNGGGIGNEGLMTVINSTFSGNSAPRGSGGGIFNDEALAVTNCTFSGNSAFPGNSSIPAQGGVISNSDFASFKNSILAGSTSGGNCSGTITDARYNISDDNSCGFNPAVSQNNTNPKLDPVGLRNNGGPTQTIALVSGSPATNTIPLNWCTDQELNQLTTDQRGFPRPDNGENVCDIGAYESQK